MTHCRSIVGESLLLLVGESTQFTGKNSRAYPSTTVCLTCPFVFGCDLSVHFGLEPVRSGPVRSGLVRSGPIRAVSSGPKYGHWTVLGPFNDWSNRSMTASLRCNRSVTGQTVGRPFLLYPFRLFKARTVPFLWPVRWFLLGTGPLLGPVQYRSLGPEAKNIPYLIGGRFHFGAKLNA